MHWLHPGDAVRAPSGAPFTHVDWGPMFHMGVGVTRINPKMQATGERIQKGSVRTGSEQVHTQALLCVTWLHLMHVSWHVLDCEYLHTCC
jgi:hypothetical protein